jgi:TPR repeat protein
MNELGYMLAAGKGVAKDEAAAEAWYRQAVDVGHLKAMVNLCELISRRGAAITEADAAEAARLVRVAAERGEPAGMLNFGHMLRRGVGVAKDEAAAVGWYRRALEHGAVQAGFDLGLMLENGTGVAKDEVEAAALYRAAVDAGIVPAMVNLGAMLAGGRGVARDDAAAAKLFQKAAELGSTNGMAMKSRAPGDLGRLGYEACYRRAAELGHEGAAKRLEALGLE